MLNLKKIAAFVCSLAVIATSIVLPVTNASATTELSYGVKTGNSAFGGSSFGGYYTNVVVTTSGLFTDFENYNLTNGGSLQFYVTKDVFTSVNVTALPVGNDGMSTGLFGFVYGRDLGTMANITPIEGNDKYDLLILTYYGSDAYVTVTNDLVELKLNFVKTIKTDFPDVEIIPKTDDSYIGICGEDTVLIESVESFVDTDYVYTIKGGTNQVTKTATSTEPEEPTEPEIKDTDWTTTTDVVANPDATDPEKPNLFEGTTGSAAYAYKVNLATESGHKYMTWRVTVDGVSRGKHVDLANCTLNGEGDTQFGLAIGFTSPEEAAKLDKVEAIWGKIEKNSEGKIVNTENDNQ